MISVLHSPKIGEALELAPYSNFLDARARRAASEIGLKCGIGRDFRPSSDRLSVRFWHRTGRTFVVTQDGQRRAYTIGILQFSLYASNAVADDTAEMGMQLVDTFDRKEWEVPSSGRIVVGKMAYQPLNICLKGWGVGVVDGSFKIVRSF